MKCALLGDPVTGSHPLFGGIGGSVTEASPNVNMDGKPAARQGDHTTETCGCGGGQGTLVDVSPSVFINGRPAAHGLVSIQPHAGSARLSGGATSTVNIA